MLCVAFLFYFAHIFMSYFEIITEKEDEAASQTMQQGYEEFAEQFER